MFPIFWARLMSEPDMVGLQTLQGAQNGRIMRVGPHLHATVLHSAAAAASCRRHNSIQHDTVCPSTKSQRGNAVGTTANAGTQMCGELCVQGVGVCGNIV